MNEKVLCRNNCFTYPIIVDRLIYVKPTTVNNEL